MKLGAVSLVMMCGLLTGCSSWIPTVANNGLNYGINIGRTISADRSLFNVLDDLSIKNTINYALLDEALMLSISTDVYQGRVMLTGSVKDAETRQKAEDLARQVDGVRELYNEIQVTDESRLMSFPKDLFIENMLEARMVLEPGVTSVNYQMRAEKGVVYVLGIAQSRAELDQVIALARVSGARKIVSHVFLSEHIVLDGAPEPTAEAKAEPEPVRAGGEPARVGAKTDELKAKPPAKAAKKKPAPLPAPPQTATR
ncbi:MAG: BON domain-containing protein [Nitrospirales bacterium]|nr:BON domain-containing protein [Nitrospirales bacterium]